MSAPISFAAIAQRYLRESDRWVSNKELSAHVGIGLTSTGRLLAPLVASSVLQREFRGDVLMWRITPEKKERIFGTDWPPGFVSQFFVEVDPHAKRGQQ